MPRPSSPLNAKASVRSPYALDRSQQNPCVDPRRPVRGDDGRAWALFIYCQTMSSRDHPSKPVRPGRPFVHDVNSADRQAGAETCDPRSRGDGGARRDRTDDLMLAKHALYRLSYGPSPEGAAAAGNVVVDACPIFNAGHPDIGHLSGGAAGRPGQTRTADLTLIRRTL